MGLIEMVMVLVFAFVCLSCNIVEGFTSSIQRGNRRHVSTRHHFGKEVTGSFFNPIPESSDNDNSEEEKEEEGDMMDRSIADLMKSRKAKSRASNPSTLGGVPTSKATGFGKKQTQTSKQQQSASSHDSSYIGIGPKGQVAKMSGAQQYVNDVNNPEYDDQGYTLHTNEVTGEKKRVFEALVEYPCNFTMKIVGRNEGAFVLEIVQVVADSCQVTIDDVPYTKRENGKWTSVTVQAPVKNADMLYTLYENVDRDPRVKFKF